MARSNSVDQIVHLDQFQYEAMVAGITRKLHQEINRTNHANKFHDFSISAGRNAGGVNSYHHRRSRAEEYLSPSKLGIPSFHGMVDSEAYMEWEEEMELVFSYHHYTEAKKIKLATSGFSEHAIYWWNQIASTRRRTGESQISSWFEMKFVMKKRFAPDYNQFGYVQDSPRQRRSQEKTIRSRSTRDEAAAKAVRKSLEERFTPRPSSAKVPPTRSMEAPNDARDVFYSRGGDKKHVPLPNSSEGKASVTEGKFNKDLFVVPSVSVLDKTCMGFTNLKPVQPSIQKFSLQDHEENQLEETTKRSPLDRSLVDETNLVPAQTSHSVLVENRFKLCKDIGVPSSLPSLFMLVTPDEEKQFGLENVKELCVSGIVFDKMIQSFEAPKYEMFSRPECSLLAETCDSKFVLNHKLIRRTVGQKLIGIDVDHEPVHKLLPNLNSVRIGYETLCCEDFWVIKPCDMNPALRENVFGSSSKLEHGFAWFERVLSKSRTDCAWIDFWLRNIGDLLRAKKMSEFEYVEKVSKLAQSNLFASHYIFLFGLCSKVKFCASECSDARMTYDLILDGDSRNLNLVFKVLHLDNSFVYFCRTFDVVFLVFARKQDRQVMEFVPRTRRIQGLDKQVDYGPKEHLFVPAWQPFSTSQGENIFDHSSSVSNLFSFIADDLDLRSNPFKGGGDGAILERPEEDIKQPTSDNEQCLQMEQDKDKENVDLCNEPNLELDQEQPMDVELGQEQPMDVELDQWDGKEHTAQERKAQDVWISPKTQVMAKTQRKPILQVAWAWLRRKRKKLIRFKQLGLFNCF